MNHRCVDCNRQMDEEYLYVTCPRCLVKKRTSAEKTRKRVGEKEWQAQRLRRQRRLAARRMREGLCPRCGRMRDNQERICCEFCRRGVRRLHRASRERMAA